MRQRTRDLPLSPVDWAVEFMYDIWRPIGYTIYNRTGVNYQSAERQTIEDMVIPNYRVRSARGEIFNNPCIRSTKKIVAPYWYADFHWNDPYYGPNEQVGFFSPLPSFQNGSNSLLSMGDFGISQTWTSDVPDLESEIGIAANAAYAGVDASEMAALASIGEMQETVSSLISISRRAIKILRAIRKRDLKTLEKEVSFGDLQDRWMEARYAIRPLIYDAYGLMAAAARKYESTRQTSRGYSPGIEFGVSDTTSAVAIVLPVGAFTATIRRKQRATVKVQAGVLYTYLLDRLGSLQAFGFDQPLEALWELLPSSFIYDWFFDIGNTLAAWTENVGCKVLSSWVTTIAEMWVEYSYVSGLPPSNVNWIGNPSTYATHSLIPQPLTYTERVVTRSPGDYRSITPHWNLKLNVPKLIDLGIIGKNKFRPFLSQTGGKKRC